MIDKELINRINELARKQKGPGLTEEEKAEQARLRKRYLSAMRSRVKQTLDSVKIVDDEDGGPKH